jgi:hypothetical protein
MIIEIPTKEPTAQFVADPTTIPSTPPSASDDRQIASEYESSLRLLIYRTPPIPKPPAIPLSKDSLAHGIDPISITSLH